jgi:predicted O-methyltransferase YrrM
MRALIFTLTVFLASLLLFAAEPMFAKMILPLLGGAPAVWNTCVVFFQACVLVGYAYAHVSTSLLGLRAGAIVQLALMAAAILALPIAVPSGWTPVADAAPVLWLLKLLTVSVGLPFLMVSTISPLMQRWFAAAGGKSASNPYFLYSAGNLGSMLALLSYPLLIEPSLRLSSQSRSWSTGYCLLLALVAACAISLFRAPLSSRPPAAAAGVNDSITWRWRLLWIVLSLVPASYLLGVTTYLTSDIAAVPLLWVLPLALYLLTFIIAFSRESPPLLKSATALMPFAVVAVVLWTVASVGRPIWLVMGSHLLAFVVVCTVCHGELSRRRPRADRLTEYYLLISFGGVIGGVFNALVAPRIFTSTFEYPVAIALGCMLAPSLARVRTSRTLVLDVAVPVLVLGASFAAVMLQLRAPETRINTAVLLAAAPVFLCFTARKRPLRFGLCIGAALLAATIGAGRRDQLLLAHRSFYGIHRVTRADDNFNELFHGSTLHGRQRIDPNTQEPAAPREPLTYYHRSGPIGQLLTASIARHRDRRTLEVALVGLGVGSLAAYAEPDVRMCFYEIDPAVIEIAQRSGYFSFLADAQRRGVPLVIVPGDARLTLVAAADKSFDIIVLDAFSGDAIPVHLLTREAMLMYLSKLRSGGLIAVHTSNQYLHLEPVVTRVAQELGCACVGWLDLQLSPEDRATGKTASEWVAVTQDQSGTSGLLASGGWRMLAPDPGLSAWTDDFSNIIRSFRRTNGPSN